MRGFSPCIAVGLCLVAMTIACARPRPQPKPPLKTPIAAPRPVPPAPPRPATETRAVWISDTGRLDWDAATRDLQRTGFNTMYVNLASAGVAFYPGSKVLPSLADGSQDEIARGIALARQRGIAVHAKHIVMFAFKSPTAFQQQLLGADRVMRGPGGRPVVQSGSYWLCPAQTANREMSLAVVSEMLTRYPVAGLQFDYIRYFEEPCCFCRTCRASFEKWISRPVAKWPADVVTGELADRYHEFREAWITAWTSDLSARARSVRPGIQISAAVFPTIQRARQEKSQNWKLWLDRGYLDVICPMNYTTDPVDFEQRCRGLLALAPREKIVMGLAGWKFERMEQMTRQISIGRSLGLAGFALFSYDDAAARDFLPHVRPK